MTGGKHVYLDWLTDLVMLSEREYQMTKNCEYEISNNNFFFEHVALAFPRDSPWINKFNKEIRMMMQGGLIKRWKTVLWKQFYYVFVSHETQLDLAFNNVKPKEKCFVFD